MSDSGRTMRAAGTRPKCKLTQPTRAELDALASDAHASCRCDGGNTMGCGACVAERKLNALIAAGLVTRHAAHRGDFTNPTYSLGTARPVRAKRTTTNPWKEAVIEACIVNCIDWAENDARKTLRDLISWETTVALDPRVSKQAHDLLMTNPEQVFNPQIRIAAEILRDAGYVEAALSPSKILEEMIANLRANVRANKRKVLVIKRVPKIKPKKYRWEYCGDCDGVGWVEGGKVLQTTCKHCKGKGKIRIKL